MSRRTAFCRSGQPLIAKINALRLLAQAATADSKGFDCCCAEVATDSTSKVWLLLMLSSLHSSASHLSFASFVSAVSSLVSGISRARTRSICAPSVTSPMCSAISSCRTISMPARSARSISTGSYMWMCRRRRSMRSRAAFRSSKGEKLRSGDSG